MTGIFGETYDFVVLLGGEVVEIVVNRVLRRTSISYFVVEMRTGRLAGISDKANQIATSNLLARYRNQLRQVSVAGDIIETMVNLDHIAVRPRHEDVRTKPSAVA